MQPVMRQPQYLQYLQGRSFAPYVNSDPKNRTQTPVNAACVYGRHCMLCNGYHVHLIYRVLFSSLQISPIIAVHPVASCEVRKVIFRL
jgi:hypothetical protein